ncbi:MAG: hypothetical protein ABIZ70_03500 [Gemmatimonadales bacterium]
MTGHTPSEPFTRASIYLGPLFEAHGFRVVARDYDEGIESSASAEYSLGDVRLRLAWDGEERVVWIEAARQSGGAVVSRWTDIEWAVAGKRLAPDDDLTDARLETLANALVAFLARGRSAKDATESPAAQSTPEAT